MSLALGNEPGHQANAPQGFSLARGALHEFYAARQADGVGLAALALMLGEAGQRRTQLWIRHEAAARETGAPSPIGLAELGFDPARILLVRARDALSALQAGLEGARCTALGAVVIELWGEVRAYDLTASRRLSLAAKASGVPVFMLRVAADPAPSGVETRWRARVAPSRSQPANAPGHPAFHLTLLRARNAQEGLQHHLEWNRDAKRFENDLVGSADPGYGGERGPGPHAPLPGAAVPVSFNRPGAARDEPAQQRRAG
jgi:protein ImuA